MTAKEQVRLMEGFTRSFPQLTERELAIIGANSYAISYDAGDIIYKENSLTSHILYLRSGLVKIMRESDNHQNIILKIIPANNFIGLMSIMGKKTFDYSAVAIDKCEVLTIHLDAFKEIVNHNPSFSFFLVQLLSTESLNIINNLISVNQKQLPGRIADVLLFFYNLYASTTFSLPLTRKELAEFASTSKESFIRTLSEFKNDKIIDIDDSRKITINSLDILEKLSKFG